MKKGMIVLFILLSLSLEVQARNNSLNYWRCEAHDSSTKLWTVSHDYQRVAINKALELCKQESKNPGSCEVSKEACDYYVDGLNTSPAWQCTALDADAQPWYSNVYKHKDDAALAAQSYCKANSSIPGTCYMNMLTCSNLNEQQL